MSRKLWAFLLSELHVIRILCQKKGCGGIIEMPIERLSKPNVYDLKCPGCNEIFFSKSTTENPFISLAKTAELFGRYRDSVDIEFVVPDLDEKPVMEKNGD